MPSKKSAKLKKTSFLIYNLNILLHILTKKSFTSEDVKNKYESKTVVDSFEPQIVLQKPERAVLDELMNKLPEMKMLDIGVGAGRTSLHFAPLVKEYVGIDYSTSMIEICRRKYPHLKFEVADAKKMVSFRDAYFDFVLFSFNGLDSVEHEDRLQILREIRRITKTQGFFCFSSHNMNSFQHSPIKASKNAFTTLENIHMILVAIFLNLRARKIFLYPSLSNGYFMFYHGHANVLFKTYFVSPVEQRKQLRDAGFVVAKIYGLDGREIKNTADEVDDWLYFLCKL